MGRPAIDADADAVGGDSVGVRTALSECRARDQESAQPQGRAVAGGEAALCVAHTHANADERLSI